MVIVKTFSLSYWSSFITKNDLSGISGTEDQGMLCALVREHPLHPCRFCPRDSSCQWGAAALGSLGHRYQGQEPQCKRTGENG